jgi:hypothetical protein
MSVNPSSDNEDGDMEVVMTHKGLMDGALDDSKPEISCRYGERCTRRKSTIILECFVLMCRTFSRLQIFAPRYKTYTERLKIPLPKSLGYKWRSKRFEHEQE